MADDAAISAEVLLRPAPGFDASVPITSTNLADALPDADVVDRVRRYFEQAGFEVGPSGPLSFSITGPASSFSDHFGAPPRRHRFSLRVLPSEVAEAVDSVVTTPPPDFGPTNP